MSGMVTEEVNMDEQNPNMSSSERKGGSTIMNMRNEKVSRYKENLKVFSSEESQLNDDIVATKSTCSKEVVQEISSDEGWQEANPKGRFGNSVRKLQRRRPATSKLQINRNNRTNFREGSPSYMNENISPAVKTAPKPIQAEPTKLPQLKNSVSSKVLSASANPTAMASRSLSYKEVAVSPPGTLLKPLLEKKEEPNKGKTQISVCIGSLNETSKEAEESESQLEKFTHEIEDKASSVINDEKKSIVETNGSKLSAAAEPFNPSHQLNPVPFGPRSLLYHRIHHSLSLKNGLLKYQKDPLVDTAGFSSARIMNPHAPEFVPRKAWPANSANLNSRDTVDSTTSTDMSKEAKKEIDRLEKSELARQILLSFIVKSVQHNMDPAINSKKSKSLDDSGDPIANDGAIIKIFSDGERSKGGDFNNTNNGDGEGFVVVTKRRKNRQQQFSNSADGLRNQQSICASAR